MTISRSVTLVKAACQAGETFAVGKAGPELVVVVVEVVEVDEVVVEVVDPPPPVPPGRHCQYPERRCRP